MTGGHKHQWAALQSNTGELSAVCIICKQPYKENNKKKYAKVEGDYITFETFQQVYKKEQNPLYKLAYNIAWYLVPRVDELNDFRPKDIDAGLIRDVHTLNNYRGKTDQFDTLPMPDFLHTQIMEYIKDEHIKPDAPIIPRHRTTLYQHMAGTKVKPKNINDPPARKGGAGVMVVSGQKPLHPHALRRGGAIYMYFVQKKPIAVPQFYLGHTTPTMTERYIGVSKIHAGMAAADYARSLTN